MLLAAAGGGDDGQGGAGLGPVGVFLPRNDIPGGLQDVQVLDKLAARGGNNAPLGPEGNATHPAQVGAGPPRFDQLHGCRFAFIADDDVHLGVAVEHLLVHEAGMGVAQHGESFGRFFLGDAADFDAIEHRGGNTGDEDSIGSLAAEGFPNLVQGVEAGHGVVEGHAIARSLESPANVKQAQRKPGAGGLHHPRMVGGSHQENFGSGTAHDWK